MSPPPSSLPCFQLSSITACSSANKSACVLQNTAMALSAPSRSKGALLGHKWLDCVPRQFSCLSFWHGPRLKRKDGQERNNHSFPQTTTSKYSFSTTRFCLSSRARKLGWLNHRILTRCLSHPPMAIIPTLGPTSLRQFSDDTGRSKLTSSGSQFQLTSGIAGNMANLGDSKAVLESMNKVFQPPGLSTAFYLSEKGPYAKESKSRGSSPKETIGEGSDIGSDQETILNTHLDLLQQRPELDEFNEIITTPLFTEAVRKHALSLPSRSAKKPFSQYGLLGGCLADDIYGSASSDPRLFWNITAPSSFFICGSQGSGKSYTLSCLLENALAQCKASVLPRPLAAIVFHYDAFISATGGSPCEVASLSSNPDIKVRVLCPPTNIRTLKVRLPSHICLLFLPSLPSVLFADALLMS